MNIPPPQYPVQLTNAWWQKNKGTIAKIKTKDDGTGIGKLLVDLERDFRKIKWEPLDLDHGWPGRVGTRTADEVKQGVALVAALSKQSHALSREAITVERAARDLAALWKNDRLMPKSSTAAAKAVSDAAKALSFATSDGTMTEYAKRLIAQDRADTAKHQADLRKVIAGVPAQLLTVATRARAGMPVDEWGAFWSGPVRAPGTHFPRIKVLHPKAAADIAIFEKYSRGSATPTDQQQLDGWLTELADAALAIRAEIS